VKRLEQKPRLPLDTILKEDVYQEEPAGLLHYNKICRSYYAGRAEGSRTDTWTRQISKMVGQPARPHMRSFLSSRGFEFK
jgi:nitroreductase